MHKELLGHYTYLFGVLDMFTNLGNEPNISYAVGAYIPSGGSAKRTLSLKRPAGINGGWLGDHSLNQGEGDNVLYGMGLIQDGDLWAVGYYEDTSTAPSTLRTLTEWRTGDLDNGYWVLKSSPNVGTNENILRGVAAVPGTSICAGGYNWAVGYYKDGGVAHTMAMLYYISAQCDLTP